MAAKQKEIVPNTTPAHVAVFDTETDPFEDGLIVKPFFCNFYDGTSLHEWWGDDCIAQFFRWLDDQPEPFLIFAHNAGNFDFFFMLEYMEDELRLINRRIVKCWHGQHEFRDSFAIIPEALKDFHGKNTKKEIDYAIFKRGVRQAHQMEIREYAKWDLLALYEGVTKFREQIGENLTVGGAAMKWMKKFHSFQSGGAGYDERFRPFYFGGRCECFKSGMISGDYKIYDINGAYPYVMKDYKHPVSITYEINRFITSKTTFALIEAKNYGCLPVRTKTGIDFTVERGVFYASIHEIIAGLETGTLEVIKVKHAIEHSEVSTFAEFVDFFMERKIACEKQGDKLGRSINKRMANACYGKFAQNPEHYCDHFITHNEAMPEPWQLSETNGEYIIWEKPSRHKAYYNIATAASITGATRAVLLRGLAGATDPVYCDTDSIVCKRLEGVEIDATKIGAWKYEGCGASMAIAGKKLYAIFGADETVVKQASKGAKLQASQIVEAAQGGVIVHANPVPRFQLDGGARFIKRNIKATAKPGLPPSKSRRKGSFAIQRLRDI